MQRQDRRQTLQSVAWFRDLHKRQLLDLDPPYQRRSVWNHNYREFFVETVLLNYPAPTIFLHEQISGEGRATYSVVDGKQRLTTVLDFADDAFPVREGSAIGHDGEVFSQLPDEVRTTFWRYQFSVEYLPITDGGVLTDVFDRLNRNVARLTRQELRHARYAGKFTETAEQLADEITDALPSGFPNIAASSRRQMKDVELASQLLLLVENGPQTFSQDELDNAYSERDEEWSNQPTVLRRFHRIVSYLSELAQLGNPVMSSTRLRNQADFYSLFGAIDSLQRASRLVEPATAAERLSSFIRTVNSEDERLQDASARAYYDAARSASNDLEKRRTRIRILTDVLTGAYSK